MDVIIICLEVKKSDMLVEVEGCCVIIDVENVFLDVLINMKVVLVCFEVMLKVLVEVVKFVEKIDLICIYYVFGFN